MVLLFWEAFIKLANAWHITGGKEIYCSSPLQPTVPSSMLIHQIRIFSRQLYFYINFTVHISRYTFLCLIVYSGELLHLCMLHKRCCVRTVFFALTRPGAHMGAVCAGGEGKTSLLHQQRKAVLRVYYYKLSFLKTSISLHISWETADSNVGTSVSADSTITHTRPCFFVRPLLRCLPRCLWLRLFMLQRMLVVYIQAKYYDSLVF